MGRVVTEVELLEERERARQQERSVVFTNGCFDLVHSGHVRTLRAARALGDLLVVALNDDASVRRLGKGADRPLVPEGSRLEVIAALEMVDFATLFSEETPLRLIEALQPDVLAKGGDWAPEEIVGSEVVERRGGRVVALPFHDGFSTTDLARRIRASESKPH